MLDQEEFVGTASAGVYVQGPDRGLWAQPVCRGHEGTDYGRVHFRLRVRLAGLSGQHVLSSAKI